jgi:hypothetical protein
MTLKRRPVLAVSAVALVAAVLGLAVFALFGGLDRTVTERVGVAAPASCELRSSTRCWASMSPRTDS